MKKLNRRPGTNKYQKHETHEGLIMSIVGMFYLFACGFSFVFLHGCRFSGRTGWQICPEFLVHSDMMFSDIIVPTLDTIRSAFMLELLLTNNKTVRYEISFRIRVFWIS